MQYKFRGKSKETKQWVFGSLVYVKDGNENEIPVIVLSYGPHSFDWIDVIPETVGMFTGLSDVEGNDIYIGDILESPNFSRYIVCFENGNVIGWQKGRTVYLDRCWFEKSLLKGSIHD